MPRLPQFSLQLQHASKMFHIEDVDKMSTFDWDTDTRQNYTTQQITLHLCK